MLIKPSANGLTVSHRAPFFSSAFMFFPSHFRVFGRPYESTITLTHDHSVTIDVVGLELTSLDVDPKVAFDVAYHSFAAGHATPSLHVVASGLLSFFFFLIF